MKLAATFFQLLIPWLLLSGLIVAPRSRRYGGTGRPGPIARQIALIVLLMGIIASGLIAVLSEHLPPTFNWL